MMIKSNKKKATASEFQYDREVVIASIIVNSFTVIISVPVIIYPFVILIHRCLVTKFSPFPYIT